MNRASVRGQDHIVGLGKDLPVPLQHHRQNLGAPGLDLLDVAHHFVKQRLIAGQGDHGTVLFNEGNGAVLELPGGIGLRVEVGNLLELQGPLHTGGIVHIPANEKHIVVPVVLLSQGGEIGVEVNGPLNKARELKNGLHQFLVPLIIQFAQAASQINRQHVQHRHLGGVALGGGPPRSPARPKCK